MGGDSTIWYIDLQIQSSIIKISINLITKSLVVKACELNIKLPTNLLDCIFRESGLFARSWMHSISYSTSLVSRTGIPPTYDVYKIGPSIVWQCIQKVLLFYEQAYHVGPYYI